MMRTKVYTSDGEVIWVTNNRGERANAPSKTANRRRLGKNPSFSIERQDAGNTSGTKKEQQEPVYMVDEEDIVTEEFLEEEMLDIHGDDDGEDETLLEPMPSSRAPQRTAAEDRLEEMRYKLAKWSADYRITDGALDDLLSLLKVHNVPGLPESGRNLKSLLKRSGMADDHEYAADDFDVDRSPPRTRANRKRALEGGKSTVTVDVDHLNELMDKMDIIDRKLDMLTANGTAHSRMLKSVLSVIATVKATVSGEPVDQEEDSTVDPEYESYFVKISFPVKDQKEFLRLEKFSHERDGEAALHQCFAEEPAHDLYEFLRSNVERLFKNTSRYSWSGKSAANAKHNEESLTACDLNILRVLTECAIERFNQSHETCTEKLKKALANYNAAVHAKNQRSMNKSVNFVSEEEDKEA